MGYHGEFVRIDFQSSDASSGSNPLTLYDDDGNARSLEAHERLVFKDVLVAVADAAAPLDLYNDTDGGNDVDAGNLLLRAQTSGEFDLCNVASNIGEMPKVLAGGSGEVRITGGAYIINGKTPSHRPDWKESDFGQS